MRTLLKTGLNLLSQGLILPLVIPCWVEELVLGKHAEHIFQFCGQLLALIPGLPGVFFRRAFYSLALEHCSLHCFIGFGSLFSHRQTTIKEHVYIGNYTMIGSAHIGKNTLIGSRVSILSGKSVHVRTADGAWTDFDPTRMTTVQIGENVWIGEGSIVMADIGEGSMVGAGAVVSSPIQPHIVVAGNPARFIRSLKKSTTSAGP